MLAQGKQHNFAKAAHERVAIFGRSEIGDVNRTGIYDSEMPNQWNVSLHFHADEASFGLFNRTPHLSARNTISIYQLITLMLAISLITSGLYFYPTSTVLILSVIFTVFYLANAVFRAGILANFEVRNLNNGSYDMASNSCDAEYCILAALYHESNQVHDLIKSLHQLKWIKERKQIYLICEVDDNETILAIRRFQLPENIHLIIVPDGAPRTKPRALNYCLSQIKGDYLVIYDAEDRPHPDQLLEAFEKFSHSSPNMVCLQAPLTIDNNSQSWLAKLFSIEYDTLFCGILPVLAKWNSPIPLGGTSNHFKLEKLREVGGWDPFNVSEDADLGIRFARFGYDCETITLPTYEEAPTKFNPWIKQRTRWIKGWMQTLLVLFRNPSRTCRDMGVIKFIQLQVVFTSTVISSLVHPLFLSVFILQMMKVSSGISLENHDLTIAGISAFNLVAGYTTYGFLCWTVLKTKNSEFSLLWILSLPIYWILISMAAWRAVYQLIFKPHLWEKTPHGITKRQTPEFTK